MATRDQQDVRRGEAAALCDSVAAAVLNARTELNVNQEHFAAMIGVKQPMIAQLEHGRRKPSPSLAYRLAKVSGQPLEFFVEEHYGQQIG